MSFVSMSFPWKSDPEVSLRFVKIQRPALCSILACRLETEASFSSKSTPFPRPMTKGFSAGIFWTKKVDAMKTLG